MARNTPEDSIAALLAEAADARASGELEREAEALHHALELDPNHLEVTLLRGDNLAAQSDRRAAASFYQRALGIARQSGSPPDLRPSLETAAHYLQESMSLYRESLTKALADHQDAGLRFQHGVEMLHGERAIYLQQPSVLYTPYLPQRQFFEREEFSWTSRLEARTDAIRRELAALLESNADFQPYVEAQSNRPARDFFGLEGDPSWSAFYLYKSGQIAAENASRCPETMTAISDVPLSRIGERTPSVFFSLLRPGAHIPPHHGMLNCRLICHLPLIVPDGCWLRVGNETRSWEMGKLLIFDDSVKHEAKNGSDQLRVVLIFDIWRPELSEPERSGISTIFDTIDQFRMLPAE